MISEGLKTLICVADCGSFNQAAERLFLSPPAVMKQVNALEAELGLKLLERSRRGVRLTAGGEILYRHARKMQREGETALAEARRAMEAEKSVLRVGTSLLNPCKPFMDLWRGLGERVSGFKIEVTPFDDDRAGILSVIARVGADFDFIVAVCDSAQWLRLCRFIPLGAYKHCVAVPVGHPLAGKKRLRADDLHGETLVMVKRGDSPMNDRLRDALEREHAQVRIEDTEHFYDISVFNRCACEGKLLLTLECWKDVHPGLTTLPVEWDCAIPYGLLCAREPSGEARSFLRKAGLEAGKSDF